MKIEVSRVWELSTFTRLRWRRGRNNGPYVCSAMSLDSRAYYTFLRLPAHTCDAHGETYVQVEFFFFFFLLD